MTMANLMAPLAALLLAGALGCQSTSNKSQQPAAVIRRVAADPAKLDGEAVTLARQAAAEQRRVLVYFHADWCGPCQRIGKAFERPSNKELFSKWELLPVNVDELPNNGPALGVQFETIPFFVKLDGSGKAVGTLGGEAFGADPTDEKVDEVFRTFLRT